MSTTAVNEASRVLARDARSSEFPSTKKLWVWSLVSAACAFVGSFWSMSGTAVVTVCLASSTVAWTDVRWRRIPNAVCVSLGLFALAAAALVDGPVVGSVLVGAGFAAGPMFMLHLIDPRWVGFGDVKFLAALGAGFGLLWSPLGLLVLWVAGVLALVARPWVPSEWNRAVPFGFWLAVASIPISVTAAVLL